jgi:hypothetical protein
MGNGAPGAGGMSNGAAGASGVPAGVCFYSVNMFSDVHRFATYLFFVFM